MQSEKIITEKKNLCVDFAVGKPISLRKINTSFTTVRVYDGKRIGVAGQIGKTDCTQLEKKAEAALSRNIPYPCLFGSDVKYDDSVKDIIPYDSFLQTCQSVSEKLRDLLPMFILSGKLELDETSKHYSNTAKSDLKYAGNNLLVYLAFKSKKSASINDFSFEQYGCFYNEKDILNNCKILGDAYLNEVGMPESPLPVAINCGLIPRFIIGDLIAETYRSGAGKFADRLENKLFSDKFTLSVNRNATSSVNLPFFDAEGTSDCNLKLFENGILKGLLTNKRSSAVFRLPLSSSAATDSFDSVPSYGTEGIHVSDTAEKITDIAQDFIYVSDTAGGEIAPNGNLGLPLQLCYLVRGGKIVGKLPESKLTANIFDMLGASYIGTARNTVLNGTNTNLSLFDIKIS